MISGAAARCTSPAVRACRGGAGRGGAAGKEGHFYVCRNSDLGALQKIPARKVLWWQGCDIPLTPAVKQSLGSSASSQCWFCLRRSRCFPHASELSLPEISRAQKCREIPGIFFPQDCPSLLACAVVRSVSVEPEAPWAAGFLTLTRLSVPALSNAVFFAPCSSSVTMWMEKGNKLNFHFSGKDWILLVKLACFCMWEKSPVEDKQQASFSLG